MSLKLEKYIKFQGTLVCKTGLRVGGSREDIEIGGLDNPIIRDSVTKLPYIPGSSLKGKLRSLLEYRYCADEIKEKGEPCGCARENCPVCRLFVHLSVHLPVHAVPAVTAFGPQSIRPKDI